MYPKNISTHQLVLDRLYLKFKTNVQYFVNETCPHELIFDMNTYYSIIHIITNTFNIQIRTTLIYC